MKVAVVGAGAMGSLFGGILAKNGADIKLFDVWQEHVNHINTHGLIIEKEGQKHIVTITASANMAEVSKAELVILFVKSYNTLGAAQAIAKYVNDNAAVMTLQNGVGNVETLVTILGNRKVLAGTTSFAATLLEPGVVRFTGVGENYIGELSGKNSDRIQKIMDMFNAAGLTTKVADNVAGAIWSKMLVNTGINALTGLLHINNGDIFAYPELEKVSAKAIDEGIMVAEKKGIELIFSPHEKVKEVARLTKNNKSSMLQDLEHGRKTEIMAINGAIWQEGIAHDMSTPVNEILTFLVRSLELKAQGLKH